MTVRAHRSLRTWFRATIIFNCSLALLTAGIALFGYETWQQRQSAARELAGQAAVVAESVNAALSFNDPDAARQTLESLKGDQRLIEAVVFDSDGHRFAAYAQPAAGRRFAPVSPHSSGVYFENGSILAFQEVRLGGQKAGAVYLRSYNDIRERLRRYVGILLLVLFGSLLLSALVSSRLQRTIVDPIAELSAVARRVSSDKNYAIRAGGEDRGHREPREITVLVDSFNEMLAQVEHHIEARRRDAESLRESEERYALAARGANDGLWDWKISAGEVYFSSRWNQMLGYPAEESRGTPSRWLDCIHPTDRERVEKQLSTHLDGRTPEFVSEYRARQHSGTYIWVLSRGIAVRDAGGQAVRMAGSQTDITGGKVADPLTGLPNRLYFIDRLECALEASRESNVPCAVLFLDLDRFKLINDSLGHAAGDELLLEVARRLNSSADESQRIASRSSVIVTRLGGDEFAILINNVEDPNQPVLIAEGILKRMSSPFTLNGRDVFVSVSIGLSLSAGTEQPEDVLRNADTAMYWAKAHGKNRFEIFDERMRESAIGRLEIETDLRRAIDEGELTLVFHPEVCLETEHTIGYEALVRWNHPQRGLLFPNTFIPVAEESDLIVGLGRWVLAEACRQMAEWQTHIPFEPALTISVNVSPRQLNEPGFVDEVRAVLARTGLNPACLKLEMTESSIMTNPEAALTMLRGLKELGVGLEIDDFGTGYSSLSYLRRLPFDTLKIDRSFVTDMCTHPESGEIVNTILELARSLGMQVVAEGVESSDQIDRLRALGCNFAQGYYFSKPIAAAPTRALMQERFEIERNFRVLQAEHDTSLSQVGEAVLI